MDERSIKGSAIILAIFVITAVCYITYINKKIDRERIQFEIQYPQLKKQDCVSEVVFSMLYQNDHIMTQAAFVTLKNNKNFTIYAEDYSGEDRYLLYNSVAIGDSIIKRCNSDSLIIKHDGTYYYFKLLYYNE